MRDLKGRLWYIKGLKFFLYKVEPGTTTQLFLLFSL